MSSTVGISTSLAGERRSLPFKSFPRRAQGLSLSKANRSTARLRHRSGSSCFRKKSPSCPPFSKGDQSNKRKEILRCKHLEIPLFRVRVPSLEKRGQRRFFEFPINLEKFSQ